MNRLWSDIRQHSFSAGCFFVCWLALFAFTFATFTSGMSNLAYVLHLLSPVAAGALVGWWRYPAREGLLSGGWRIAGAPLAAILVALFTVSVVFLREGTLALLSGNWQFADFGGFVLGWLVASAILGSISSVFGLFGALLSGLVAKHVKKTSPSMQ